MRWGRWGRPAARFVEGATEVRVRFQEVDALRIVWHGHYLSYFEDARVALGRTIGLGYEDILAAGYVAPLVHVEVDYFAPAHFEDVLTVKARLHEDAGARVTFTYEAIGPGGQRLAAGRTIQALVDLAGNLQLTRPAFYEALLGRLFPPTASQAAQ